MNKLLILTSYTKFELNSLRNNEIIDYINEITCNFMLS